MLKASRWKCIPDEKGDISETDIKLLINPENEIIYFYITKQVNYFKGNWFINLSVVR